MHRQISIHNEVYTIDLNHPVVRFKENPIVTSHDVNRVWLSPQRQVVTVHNAGITTYHDEIVMLFRSHLRNGISVIGKATSKDGLCDWIISPEPFLMPGVNIETKNYDRATCLENEAGGVEDPRIAAVDNTFYITYSAYHGTIMNRVRVSLATTTDFNKVVRHGPVQDYDMRNVVIFPEKIEGKYYAMFRPNDDSPDDIGGKYTQIKLGQCQDINSGDWIIQEQPLFCQSGGPSPFSAKIGPGATPIKTKHGWINIFHGVRSTMDGNPYVLGVALHNLTDPTDVSVSNIPILFPSKADCLTRNDDYVHVPNVVFCCGAKKWDDGTIYIYYGGNDTVMNVGITHEDILAELCRRFPQSTTTGQPLYNL